MSNKYDWVLPYQNYSVGSGSVVSFTIPVYENVILHCCNCLNKIGRLLHTTHARNEFGDTIGYTLSLEHLEKPEITKHFNTGIQPFFCKFCADKLYYICADCIPNSITASNAYDMHIEHHLPVDLVKENDF